MRKGIFHFLILCAPASFLKRLYEIKSKLIILMQWRKAIKQDYLVQRLPLKQSSTITPLNFQPTHFYIQRIGITVVDLSGIRITIRWVVNWNQKAKNLNVPKPLTETWLSVAG